MNDTGARPRPSVVLFVVETTPPPSITLNRTTKPAASLPSWYRTHNEGLGKHGSRFGFLPVAGLDEQDRWHDGFFGALAGGDRQHRRNDREYAHCTNDQTETHVGPFKVLMVSFRLERGESGQGVPITRKNNALSRPVASLNRETITGRVGIDSVKYR